MGANIHTHELRVHVKLTPNLRVPVVEDLRVNGVHGRIRWTGNTCGEILLNISTEDVDVVAEAVIPFILDELGTDTAACCVVSDRCGLLCGKRNIPEAPA